MTNVQRLQVAGALVAIAASTGLWPIARSAGQLPKCHSAPAVILIPAGEVPIGEDGPDRAGRMTHIPAFRIDRTEITNRAFGAFVAATAYVTEAEQQGGGAVFVGAAQLARGLKAPGEWWRFVQGASWRRPDGPGSSIEGRPDEPVVQVTYNDAVAYARWRGGALPTEAQWERAARGGDDTPRDPHRWSRDQHGRPTANTWQGLFPLNDERRDGFASRAPVGCFEANGFGLYDTIGNAWEWTRVADRPGPLRGGSFLCSDNYCANYRPVGRQAQEADLATSHAGFRVVTSAR